MEIHGIINFFYLTKFYIKELNIIMEIIYKML